MNIYPTKTCFNDSVEFIEQMCEDDPDGVRNDKYLLCHGIQRSNRTENGEAVTLSHAWIEEGDSVIFKGILNDEAQYFQVLKSDYYEHSGVTEVTRYTMFQFWQLNKKYKSYGPFEWKYRVLCNDVVFTKFSEQLKVFFA